MLWTTLGNLAVGGTTSLMVSVRAPAGGFVTNTATALSVTSDPNLSNNSGQAITTVVAAPTIRFYTDGTFGVIAKAKPVGEPLFVQAVAVGCNLNPTAVETNTITLVSKLTGDVESFQAIESDVNSGKFQILPSVPTANSATATPGNGTMETLQNDTITATILGCGAQSTSTVILIDPGGVVFDSLSNLPLAGATVTVVFAATELPAPVFSYDGVTPAPSTIITGPDGVFVFPVMAAGDYKFLIGPPPSYTFPTTLADGALPTNRVIVVGSRGEVFTLSDANPAVQIDIPLDTASIGTPLFIEKKADRKEAEIGDLVLYTITVRNNQTNSLAGVTLDDRLPAGFAYITNTTRTNGVAAANPTGAPRPRLTFDLGNMAAGELRTVTYRVRVVPGALQGDGKNKAKAHSTVPAGDSNIAVARVIVRAGVFSDKPFLIGKVFVDVNTNKIQDAGEPGVPGVRLYLNNGTYAITDKEGKYSLYGLEAQTHAVKVDETTLPAGWRGEQLTARHNRRGTLYTADLKFGELRKVDFADASNDPAVLDEVKRRISKGDVDVAEVQRVSSVPITTGSQPVAGNGTGLRLGTGEAATAGVLAGPGEYVAPAFGPVLPERTLNSGNSNLPTRPVRPTANGALKIVLPAQDQPADGVTPATIKVLLTDAKGAPITSRIMVTLETSRGRWQTADLDADEPGLQIAVEGGAADVVLLPPGEPGNAKIVATSGSVVADATLAFLPDLRPLIAAGVIEGRMQFHKLSLAKLEPVRSGDVFERELKNWSFSANDGRAVGGARGAVFLKGKIKGDYLLTLAYDSEKDFRDRFMRDIQPDEYYPVYGDSSVRGFEAQSSSQLYVRVDKRKCYALYGDFSTGAESPARGLGQYSRSATGIKTHFENQHGVANVWGMYDSLKQVVEEFRADGTSGPYFFSIRDALENTEKVEILVRDRHQSAVILSSTPLARFVDYEFEPFAGRLLFRAPVPSLDPNLNPVSIRVTYEVDQGGEKFWVAGVDGQLKLTSWMEVGGSLVQDNNPLNEYNLISGNLTLQVLPKTFLLAEVARSQSDVKGTGLGWRAELRRTTDMTDLRLFASRVDDRFDNPSSVISAGREELGGRATHKLTPRDLLVAEAVYTRDGTTGGERWGVSGSYAHRFLNGIQLEAGVRHSEESLVPATPSTTTIAPNTVNAVRARVTTPVPYTTNANVFAEFEQEVSKGERRSITVGGDIQVAPQTRGYFRHEFLTALDSPYDLNGEQKSHRTVFGLQTEYMKDGQLFNEYRMDSGTSGREAEAAIGLRNAWQLRHGLRLNTNFERVEPITEGGDHNVATAAGVGIEYTADPAYRATARIEGRKDDTTASILNTFGYARKLSEDWTLLTRSILNWRGNDTPGQGDLFQARLQLGAAWRQTRTDVWNALGRFEYLYEDDNTTAGSRLRRHAFIFSTHANWQPCANFTLSGRYSQKIVVEDDDTIDDVFGAHLIAGRAMYDVTKRIAVGVNASVFFSDAFRNVQYGLGPEIGFRLNDNVWLDAGYNFAGFHDRDLSGDNYTDHGFWFGMRMQFDERALEFLKPNRQK